MSDNHLLCYLLCLYAGMARPSWFRWNLVDPTWWGREMANGHIPTYSYRIPGLKGEDPHHDGGAVSRVPTRAVMRVPTRAVFRVPSYGGARSLGEETGRQERLNYRVQRVYVEVSDVSWDTVLYKVSLLP